MGFGFHHVSISIASAPHSSPQRRPVIKESSKKLVRNHPVSTESNHKCQCAGGGTKGDVEIDANHHDLRHVRLLRPHHQQRRHIPAAGGPDAPREGYIAEKGMDPCVAVASYTGQRIWKITPANNQ